MSPDYMPPINNNNNTDRLSVDYYKNRYSKVGDFLLGLIGGPTLLYLLYVLPALLLSSVIDSDSMSSSVFDIFTSILLIIPLIIVIFLMISFKRMGRRFINIGIISSIIIFPLLAFGSCMLMFSY